MEGVKGDLLPSQVQELAVDPQLLGVTKVAVRPVEFLRVQRRHGASVTGRGRHKMGGGGWHGGSQIG